MCSKWVKWFNWVCREGCPPIHSVSICTHLSKPSSQMPPHSPATTPTPMETINSTKSLQRNKKQWQTTHLKVNGAAKDVKKIQCECEIHTFLWLFHDNGQQIRPTNSTAIMYISTRCQLWSVYYPMMADKSVQTVSIQPTVDTKLMNFGVKRWSSDTLISNSAWNIPNIVPMAR